MKIRNGFISNSSSTSFIIPSFLLTDEQKEILLSIDESRDQKKDILEKLGIDFGSSENNYPKSKEYHKIYNKMIKDGEWEDWNWYMSEDKEKRYISGGASMWNGSINILMERIGVDHTLFEICNHGHNMVHMATNPEAVKFFIKLHKESVKHFEKFDKETKEMEIEFGHQPLKRSPYEMSDKEFESFGKDSLKFNAEDDYSYVRDYDYED